MSFANRCTAIIWKEEDVYVAHCPELDVASQGSTVEHARDQRVEAVELLLETASRSEWKSRRRGPVFVTSIEIEVA
ncbi:MAG: type II toxin-antitoxin system HicB family antitoxin [Planctomycetes bacterium]|nr:type II toxin-antitoxin system HicB family antitoxin [Planctomycetota bacterium]